MDDFDLRHLASARAELDGLCQKVGLQVLEKLPAIIEETDPPVGATMWAGDYACVLLWPVQSTEVAIVHSAVLAGQGWFDKLLLDMEASKSGRVVDGYLVLALPQLPEGSLEHEIRLLEVSSQVCRKHFIWPTASSSGARAWARIADITVVGLPKAATSASSDAYWPVLDENASEVWRDISGIGPVAAAQKDGETR